jgi:hypothetical protein
MKRGCLIRMALAVAIATSCGSGDALAQCTENFCPRPTPPGITLPPPSGGNATKWFVLGGLIPIIGLVATIPFNPNTGPSASPGGPPTGSPPGGGGGPGAGGTPSFTPDFTPNISPPSGQALRSGFYVPARGAACVPDEFIADAPPDQIALIAARHNLTVVQSNFFSLLNAWLHLLHINDGVPVSTTITEMSGDTQVRGAQCNSIFATAQAPEAPVSAAEQYAPAKLNLTEAHRLARGDRILIAVIDSGIDATHPDLAGAIAGVFEAAGEGEPAHPHGTGMAGAIAARRNMLGTAPGVRLLAVRAFSSRADSTEGTTYSILRGLDWAASQGARVVNMSFAGPSDPRLREALAKANAKGMVLVAAAGNAGPSSPPLFPAADPNVIAVTATNADDRLFAGANRGNYIAVAAPGVDILAPAPDGAHQFTTGTSVAAAEVSGIVALLLQRNPSLTPAEVRKILMDTAKDLGPKGRDRDFGAGLVNALKALTAVRAR